MAPLRILVTATAIELCWLTAIAAVIGLGGIVNGRWDIINVAAPLLLALAVLGAVSTRATLGPGWFRNLSIGVAAAAAIFNLLLLTPDLLRLATARPAREGQPYRVVTANLYRDNYIPSHSVARVLARQADAIMLEEIDGTAAFALGPVYQAYRGSTACPASDVGIWVRTPVLAQGCGLGMPAGAQDTWGRSFAWLQTIGPDGRPIVLAVVHLGRPYQTLRRQMELDALAKTLGRLPSGQIVLAGDFNTAPWTFAMLAADKRLSPLKRDSIFIPTYPAALGHKGFGYPVLPIDHIYTGASWRTVKVAPFAANGSDHLGVQADLRLSR